MKIEMCSFEEGCQGAWFEGTIIGIELNRDDPTFYFEHDHFVNDDWTKEPLIEQVTIQCIRPLPPIIPLPSPINVGDSVEVRENDCWWRGIVQATFKSPLSHEPFCEVYFPDTRTLKPYSCSNMRPTLDWVDGQWRPRQWN